MQNMRIDILRKQITQLYKQENEITCRRDDINDILCVINHFCSYDEHEMKKVKREYDFIEEEKRLFFTNSVMTTSIAFATSFLEEIIYKHLSSTSISIGARIGLFALNIAIFNIIAFIDTFHNTKESRKNIRQIKKNSVKRITDKTEMSNVKTNYINEFDTISKKLCQLRRQRWDLERQLEKIESEEIQKEQSSRLNEVTNQLSNKESRYNKFSILIESKQYLENIQPINEYHHEKIRIYS